MSYPPTNVPPAGGNPNPMPQFASSVLPQSPAPSNSLNHQLQLAFTRIYEQIDSLRSANQSATAQGFTDLETLVRSLNSTLSEQIKQAVREAVEESVEAAVQRGVRSAMEGMVIRYDPKIGGGQVSSAATLQAAAALAAVGASGGGNHPGPGVRVGTVAASNAAAGPSHNVFSPTGSAKHDLEDPETPPTTFTMSRDVKTVPDLWTEYTVGWDGGPPVRAMYEGTNKKQKKGRRFKDDSERKFYRRRKRVLEMVESLVNSGVNEVEAAQRVEELREKRGVTLNKLGEVLPILPSDELPLV
ncbi:hypothetical protein IAT38_001727 [Cryptococcus sp. DSM 104549]